MMSWYIDSSCIRTTSHRSEELLGRTNSVGQVLDDDGVQVRVGHHCARPTCVRFGVPATTRVSLYLYNTVAEIDALIRALDKVRKVFGR